MTSQFCSKFSGCLLRPAKRLDTYRAAESNLKSLTARLAHLPGKKGLLKIVDGAQDMETIFQSIMDILKG